MRKLVVGTFVTLDGVMQAPGGYIPTCDHSVPEEVPYEYYLYYRQHCLEMGG